jgi:hypothetical protein
MKWMCVRKGWGRPVWYPARELRQRHGLREHEAGGREARRALALEVYAVEKLARMLRRMKKLSFRSVFTLPPSAPGRWARPHGGVRERV